MIYYAVIDTNVLVSALLSSDDDAATVQIINKIYDGSIIPVFSNEILAEYNEVLRRKKFHFSEELVRTLLDSFISLGELISPSPSGEILPDMKDLPFYEVVLEKKDDDAYLITGNTRHFPAMPFVVTAREFLSILDS